MPDSRKRRNVDASRYAMVPRNDVPRSAFDITYSHKTTFDAGYLIPIYIDEVLPGDSHRVRMNAFARLATPLTPVMDNLVLESFFFFVPNRLLWDNWEAFMGEQEPDASTEYLVPTVGVTNTGSSVTLSGMLANYFGIVNQTATATAINVTALPFRAYYLIWNEWFRDQDLQASVTVSTGDGPDAFSYVLLRRGKRHDYFTTCRPWPAKPAVLTGFGSSAMNPFAPGLGYNFPGGANSFAAYARGAGAPVSGIGIDLANAPTVSGSTFAQSGGRETPWGFAYSTSSDTIYLEAGATLAGTATNFPNVRVLINDIRTANMVQLLMERNARGGTRYAEIVRSHFGVVSPDARLQRPEYLGGGRSFVNIAPIAQTSATKSGDATQPGLLGEQAGIGTAVVSNHGFSASFTEHGYIIGMVSVRADLSYQQGTDRMWYRRSRYDFYWPGLAHLGEQAVLSREIYADGSGNNTGQLATATGDYSVFGYQERWAEYRYKPNKVTGMFQSWADNPLDIWHFAQDFGSRPTLNASFIIEDPPVDRVLQVGGIEWHQFLFDSYFDVRRVRPMPMFSIPGMGPRL